MARRKQTTDMLFEGGDAPESSAPPAIPDENSAPLGSSREAAKLRLVSVKQAGTLLNRDRNTINKWLDQGCPFVTKADRALGIAWELDIADVVRWLEQRAGDAAAEKFGGEEGKTSEDEAKRRRAVAQAVVAELDMLERLRSVVPVGMVLDAWSKDYSEIRGKLMSIPDAIAGNVDVSISSKVRKIADDHIRSVLDGLKTRDTLLKPE